MKKTFSLLLALCGIASGTTTLQTAVYSSTTDITDISGISGSFAYTLNFRVDVMKGILGHNSTNDIRPMLVIANNSHNMGLAMALNNTGFVGTYDFNPNMGNLTMGGRSEENRQPMIGNGSTPATNNFADTGVTDSLASKLDGLTGLAVTFSHTDTVSSSLYVTLTFSDGTVSELYGTKDGFKWEVGVGDLTALKINEDYIANVYLFDSDVDKDTAFALNKKAIPEPATTALSLLALAGLAARRYRK